MLRDRETAALPASPSLDVAGGVENGDMREPRLFDESAHLPAIAPTLEVAVPEADAERIALALMRSGRTDEAVSFLEQEIARAKDRAWKQGALHVMRDVTPAPEEIVVPPTRLDPVVSELRPRRRTLDASLNIRPSREGADEAAPAEDELHAFDPERSGRAPRRGRLMLLALALGLGVAGGAFVVAGPQRGGSESASVARGAAPAAADMTDASVGVAEAESSEPAAEVVDAAASKPVEAEPVASIVAPVPDPVPPAEDVATLDEPAAEQPANGLAALAEPETASAAPPAEPRLPRQRPAVAPSIQTASLQPAPAVVDVPAPQVDSAEPSAPGVPWSFDPEPAYGAPVFGPANPRPVLSAEEYEQLLMQRRMAENYAAERRYAEPDEQTIVVEPYLGPDEPRRLPLGPIRRLWGN